MPPAGSFSLRVLGQNVTFDGDPLGEPMVLYEEVNPAFGAYNMTFTSPIESAPGGMIFYVQAVDLENWDQHSPIPITTPFASSWTATLRLF